MGEKYQNIKKNPCATRKMAKKWSPIFQNGHKTLENDIFDENNTIVNGEKTTGIIKFGNENELSSAQGLVAPVIDKDGAAIGGCARNR